MIRGLASFAFSILMVVTMMWGGCISCPQFFMFTAVAEKNCCEAEQCERPSKNAPVKECKRMPLEPQGFSSAHAHLAVTVLTADVQPIATTLCVPLVGHRFETAAVEHSPPDLNVLHSVLLV